MLHGVTEDFPRLVNQDGGILLVGKLGRKLMPVPSVCPSVFLPNVLPVQKNLSVVNLVLFCTRSFSALAMIASIVVVAVC